LNLSGSGVGPVEDICEHGNELSGSIKFWEIIKWLRDWRILKKDSALRS
jgi:hypothetical protein